MRANELPLHLTRLITPRALRTYAEGLGWLRVQGVNGLIAAYHSPSSANRQLIVPLDERLDDYGERTAEAVVKLADFEKRSAQDVLNHLLTPPADILGFREVSPEAEAGDISLEHGSRMIDGAKKALLAVAHSVEVPQAYHPRLSRDDARKFLSRCRMNTSRGSFVLNVACLLDQPVGLSKSEPIPFTRRVTALFVETLASLNQATQGGDAGLVADTQKSPGISANLCEALLMLRPTGDRSHLNVSAAWSRALIPENRKSVQEIQLRQEVFELVEVLAPRLRSTPEPRIDHFIGFVDELRGVSTNDDPRPSGEVRFRLYDQDESLNARADLNADDYAVAGKAHLASDAVSFEGELHRLPRINRIESVRRFAIVQI